MVHTSNDDIRITVTGYYIDLNIRQQCAARSYVIWPRQTGECGRAIVTLVPRNAGGEMQVGDRQGKYFAAVYWYTRRDDASSRSLLFRTRLPHESASEALMHLLDLVSYPEMREVGGVAGLQEEPAERGLGRSTNEDNDTNIRPASNGHYVDASALRALDSIYEVQVSSLEEDQAKLAGIPYLDLPDQDRDLQPVNDYEVHLLKAPLSQRAMAQLKDPALVNCNDVRITTTSEVDRERDPYELSIALFWLNEGEVQIYTQYRDGRTRTKPGSAYTVSETQPPNLRTGGATAAKRRLRLTRTRKGRSYEQRKLVTEGREPIDEPRYGHHRASSMTSAGSGSEHSFRTASAGEGPLPVEVVDIEPGEGVETDYTVIEQEYQDMVGTSQIAAVQAQAQVQPQVQPQAEGGAWPKPKSTRELYYENADRLRGG